MLYRRRATPLHVVRAAVGCAWCGALGLAALVCGDPIVLGAVCATVLAGGALAGCGRQLRRALRYGLPVALAVMVINALVTREGLTIIWRFGELPVLGQTDVTLEATVYGAVLGLRAVTLILCGVLYTVAVDPDQVLRLLRRVSFHSALSATLATRLVPVLARDAGRLADAQRCRPGPAPSRVALLRAASSGVLDRALDVAAALEVRGYAGAQRPARGRRAPHSRQDLGFAAAAAAVATCAVGGRIVGWAGVSAYPRLHVPAGPGVWALAAAMIVAALAPFSLRRGVGG
jgi:energy-coupling factor transport system permease protein